MALSEPVQLTKPETYVLYPKPSIFYHIESLSKVQYLLVRRIALYELSCPSGFRPFLIVDETLPSVLNRMPEKEAMVDRKCSFAKYILPHFA